MQKTQSDWCNSVLMFKNTVATNRRKNETQNMNTFSISVKLLLYHLQYCAHIAPDKYKKYTLISIRKH